MRDAETAPHTFLDHIGPFAPAAGLLPVAVLGGMGLFGAGPRFLRRHRFLAGLAGVGAAVGLVRWQLARFFSEQPTYEVEERLGDIEVRRYPARVVAETTVDGDWDDALNGGFRRLADYIFGENRDQQKLSMTTPVTTRREGGGLTVTFFMPKGRDLLSLPEPSDPGVQLLERPAERLAVRRTSGTYRGERIRRLADKLVEDVRAAGLVPTGEPGFAGYDSPATLPFLRRVELWVPV